MKTPTRLSLTRKFKSQKGVSAIVVALLLLVLLGFAALGIDVGYMFVARNQLQNIADAGALAGARDMGDIYCPTPDLICNPAATVDPARIFAVVNSVAGQNSAGDLAGISINAGDVALGVWDENAVPPFSQPPGTQPNAVRVTARRDQAANGPIATFFARTMHQDFFSVRADAIAALTSGPAEGEPDVPIVMCDYWFQQYEDNGFCQQNVKLYPANDPSGCAGWTTFTIRPSSANNLRRLINELAAGTYWDNNPPLTVGTIINMVGGNIANVLADEFQDYYDQEKDENGEWEVVLPVIECPSCMNPNQNSSIEGFAKITITGINDLPEKQILAVVDCNEIVPDPPGGPPFGSVSYMPVLVE